MIDSNSHFGSKLYSAPRRFGITTIMVVTTAYAMLFGAMRLVLADPVLMALIAGFITSVGIGQALLFHGKKPRKSSMLVGAIYFSVAIIYGTVTDPGPRYPSDLIWYAVGAVWVAVGGVILGYLAGAMVGMVFLVSDLIRRMIQPGSSDNSQGGWEREGKNEE